jgi:DNA-binding PadR family transcriptional regulator
MIVVQETETLMNGVAHDPRTSSPLTPTVFYILLALADGERHGYAIVQEISKRTAGSVRIGPGILYGSLQRMLADGLIEESIERLDPCSGNERRRYYRLSSAGWRAVRAEALRLARLVRIVESKHLLFRPKISGGLA